MAEIPQYQVDSGDFTPEEILDVIPEQERLDRQVQNDEEKYLRQLEQNAEDRIRNTEKMWGGLAKLSGKVGDILKEKQDKHRKEKSAALKNRVLMYGVGDNLAAHFSSEKRDLFDESLQIHKTASQIEQLGDLVTAEDYRDMSQWEQEAIQEEYARKKGVGYEAFVENEKLTTSIEVTDADGSVRTVKFAQKPTDYQPTAAEMSALNQKVQYKFAAQLEGIENEGLIAEQVRPHVLSYNQKLQTQAVTDRANARKVTFQNQQMESMTTTIETGTLQEGKDFYEDYVEMYQSRNGGATMLEANTQFGKDLVHLVETGKISQRKALALTDNRFEFDRGKGWITDGAGLSDLRTKILLAGNAYNEIKEQEKDSEAQSYVNILKSDEMGPISNQQAIVLTKAFNIKYKGNIPSKIRNVLKGYRPDDEAVADLEDWKRAQGGKLYGYQLRNVSNAVYNTYKGDLVGSGGPTENGTSAYKLNQKLFDAKTQNILKSNYGVGDIKSENFLYLRANVEEIYNDAYNIAFNASGKLDSATAHKTAMSAVDTFLADPDAVADAQKADNTISQQEERYVDDVSTGRDQGKNNQWKTSRMSMAGQRADEELLAWSQSTDRRVANMPRYYVDVARQLGIAPETFGLAQAALITQEPFDDKGLAKEMTEDKDILQLIFKNPNTYSVIQGVMMLEQEDEEVTKDNSLFNNPSVINEDI